MEGPPAETCSVSSYVPNPGELRYAHTLITPDVTRPARLVSAHYVKKRPIVRNAIRWSGRIVRIGRWLSKHGHYLCVL